MLLKTSKQNGQTVEIRGKAITEAIEKAARAVGITDLIAWQKLESGETLETAFFRYELKPETNGPVWCQDGRARK